MEVEELQNEMTDGLSSLKLMLQSMLDAVKESASATKEALDGASAAKETPNGVLVSINNGGDPASGSVFNIEPCMMSETSEAYGN